MRAKGVELVLVGDGEGYDLFEDCVSIAAGGALLVGDGPLQGYVADSYLVAALVGHGKAYSRDIGPLVTLGRGARLVRYFLEHGRLD